MKALQDWQAQVSACRQARQRRDETVWRKLADWYDTWVKHNDYVELVLSRLPIPLEAETRVLEIGPGSGAFTLPLASTAREVVALEPSSAMRQVLERKLAKAGLTNVRIIPEWVEKGLTDVDGSFDLTLASHSLYNVKPITDVMRALVSLSRHTVVLMGAGEQPEWYRRIHRRFRGHDRTPSPHLGHFYPALLELGVYADVEVVWASANYVYESEEALVDWWAHHLHLDGDHREALQAALLPYAERRGSEIGIYGRRRMALLTIDSKRSICNGNGGRAARHNNQ
jgi:SAM-dependent methyltransferase